jgi:hypothetical protein
MKAEEILTAVKKIVFGEMPPVEAAPVEEKQFSEYALKDGTLVMIDELAVGGTVMVGDAPAPAGSHELADGTVIEVGEGGVIATVTVPAAPEAEEEPKDMGKKYDEKFAAIESRFAALQSENENLKQAFVKADEAIKGLINLVETLVNEGGEPAIKPQQGFRHEQPTKTEKMQRLLNINPYKK